MLEKLSVSHASGGTVLTSDRTWAVGNSTDCDAIVPAPGRAGIWFQLRYASGWVLRPANGAAVTLDGQQLEIERSARLGDGPHEVRVCTAKDVIALTLAVHAAVPPLVPSVDPGSVPTAPQPPRAAPVVRTADVVKSLVGQYPVPAQGRLSVGRRGGPADVPLDGNDIALHHADVWWQHGRLTVRDRSRGAGGLSFQGGHQLVARIAPGESFLLGHQVIDVHDGSITVRPVRRPLTLVARSITAQYAGAEQPTLRDVDLNLAGGVHAIMGPSGGGKSTLCYAILGEVALHQETEILLHGISLTAPGRGEVDHLISFVPQRDSLPMDLHVKEALLFVGEMRLARDLPRADLAARVDEVLRTLELTSAADRLIQQLSGGQRKRVSVAAELLSDPLLLLLDEPTSGLDEGLDRRMMELLQALSGTGMSIVIVTHSAANLDLADEIVALTGTGHLAFNGPPHALRNAFGGAGFAQIMDRLRLGERVAAQAASDEPPGTSGHQGHVPARVRSATSVLLRREYRRLSNQSSKRGGGRARDTLARLQDRRFLYLLVAPLVTAVLAAIAGSEGLAPGGAAPADLAIVLVVLIFTSVFFATAMSAASVVGDLELIRRETRWGVSARSQITSRTLMAAGFAVIQAAASSALFLAFREGPPTAFGLPGWGALFVTLALLNIAGTCLGIAVSTLCTTVEKAVFGLMWVSVAQVVMTGLLIRFGEIANPIDRGLSVISYFLPTRWAVGALGAQLDLNSVPGESDRLWTADLGHVVEAWCAIAVLAIAYYLLAVVTLRRRNAQQL